MTPASDARSERSARGSQWPRPFGDPVRARGRPLSPYMPGASRRRRASTRPSRSPHASVASSCSSATHTTSGTTPRPCGRGFARRGRGSSAIRAVSSSGGATYIGPRTRAEVHRLMGGAAVVLMPARWDEPFGLVALEALATRHAGRGLSAGRPRRDHRSELRGARRAGRRGCVPPRSGPCTDARASSRCWTSSAVRTSSSSIGRCQCWARVGRRPRCSSSSVLLGPDPPAQATRASEPRGLPKRSPGSPRQARRTSRDRRSRRRPSPGSARHARDTRSHSDRRRPSGPR